MTLVLELDTRDESALRRWAADSGVTVEEYARRLLSACAAEREQVGGEHAVPFHCTASHEEWERRFDAWAERHRHLPTLRPEAYERANFYGERG